MIANALSWALPVFIAGVAAANYPPVPQDNTTPVQQRLAIVGPNGKQHIEEKDRADISKPCPLAGIHMAN